MNQALSTALVLSVHVITTRWNALCLSQQEGNAYLCPPLSLFVINLHQAKGFVIDILCQGRVFSQTLPRRDRRTTLERKRGGGGKLFFHHFPYFDLLLSRRCVWIWVWEKWGRGQVNKAYKDRNKESETYLFQTHCTSISLKSNPSCSRCKDLFLPQHPPPDRPVGAATLRWSLFAPYRTVCSWESTCHHFCNMLCQCAPAPAMII